MSKLGIGGGNDRTFSTGKIAAAIREGIAQREMLKRKAAEDRATEEARKRAREAERLRQGRKASILTSNRGVTEPLGTTNRPRASALLGGG